MSQEGRERNRMYMSITINTFTDVIGVFLFAMVFLAIGWFMGKASTNEDLEGEE